MKKPFRERKISKFLTSPFMKVVLGLIPGIGPIAKNILIELPDSESGTVNKKEIVSDSIQAVIQAVLVGILIILAVTGKISFADAEQAAEILEQID